MKLLIAVDKSRIKYLEPLVKELVKYNIKCKIIDDLEIYDNSLFSKKILRWFNTPSKFNQIIKDYSPDFIFTERTSHFSSLVLKTNIPLIIFIRGNMWIESEIAKKTIHTSIEKKIEIDLKNRIREKCFKNKSTIILPICNYLTEIIKNRYPNKNIKTCYQGIEIDFRAKPQPDLPYTLTGFLSIGDWQYVGDAVTRTTDEDQNVISTETQDVDGGKVGDAAQFTAGLGIDMKLAENVSFDTDVRFYDELYSDVGAVKENLLLPSFHVWDAGFSYKMYLGADDEKSLNIRVNVNNVSDAVYLSELRTNIAAGEGSGELYNGIDTANQGYFGLGRTWNVGLRYKF